MGTERRKLLTNKHKVVLWVLGLLVLWEAFDRHAIIEALLTFGFAGVVPGTHIVLSPNAVIGVLAGCLGLLFVGIIFKLLFTRPKERISTLVSLPTSEATGSQPVDAASQPVPLAADALSLPRCPGFLRRLAMVVYLFFARYVAAITRWADKQLPVVAQAMRQATHTVWAVSLIAFVFARKWVLVGYAGAKRAMAALSRWAVPYMWRFDTWLEVQVRTFTAWSAQKAHQYHALSILITMFREYKKTYRESPLAAYIADFKRQQSRSRD